MAHQLPRDTSVLDCLQLLKDGGISEKITCGCDNFILRNLTSTLLRYGETTLYSQGRRLRVRTHHWDRSARHSVWKSQLTLHQPNIFFSNINTEPDNPSQADSISRLTHPENHNQPSQNPTPHRSQTNYATPKFNILPKYSRMEPFTPATAVEKSCDLFILYILWSLICTMLMLRE